jgi:hypothetical protein
MRSKYTKAATLLAVICAISAITVSSASAALPEVVPNPTFKTPATFEGVVGWGTFESNRSRIVMQCHGTIKGDFFNAKEVNATLEFTRCGPNNFETVKSEPLKGTLGYINKTTKQVGLRLEPVTGNTWAKSFFLYGNPLLGKLIGYISPINTKATLFELQYRGKEGIQSPTEFEGALKGEKNQQLEWQSGIGLQLASLEAKFSLTFPYQEEFKA